MQSKFFFFYQIILHINIHKIQIYKKTVKIYIKNQNDNLIVKQIF